MKSEQNNVTLNMDIDDDYYNSGSLAMNMLTFYFNVVYFFVFFLSIYYMFAPRKITTIT